MAEPTPIRYGIRGLPATYLAFRTEQVGDRELLSLIPDSETLRGAVPVSHEQLDFTGGSVPLSDLDLAGHSLRLANAERERGHKLTGLEAGQLIHAARGKHTVDEICRFCAEDGTQQLITLNTHRARIAERERKARNEPPWTCVDCQHENPPEATFCRGCASTQDDDREPAVTRPDDRSGTDHPSDGPEGAERGYNHGQRPSA